MFFVFQKEKMTTISLLPRRRPTGPSRDNGVSKATLLRHLYHKNVHANAAKKHFGRCTDLPESVESELAKHVVKLGEQNVGLTTQSLRHLAYEIAEGHNLKHRFKEDTQMAGKAWSDASDEDIRNFPGAPLNRLQSPELLHSLLVP